MGGFLRRAAFTGDGIIDACETPEILGDAKPSVLLGLLLKVRCVPVSVSTTIADAPPQLAGLITASGS